MPRDLAGLDGWTKCVFEFDAAAFEDVMVV
jgi:hypothetical protein